MLIELISDQIEVLRYCLVIISPFSGAIEANKVVGGDLGLVSLNECARPVLAWEFSTDIGGENADIMMSRRESPFYKLINISH